MCGFSGLVTKHQIENTDFLLKAKEFINRRGPDAFGHLNYQSGNNNFHFQHARLSIIDLNEASNQPFQKEGYTLVYNGEIYNYKEIREELLNYKTQFLTDSDTEVIIEAFKYWGIKCLNKFIGMFSFALHDEKSNQLYLVRDRAGVKPLYFYSSENKIIFSSDLYALKYLSREKFSLNIEVVEDFFRFGYANDNCTFLNKVNKVKAGSYVLVDLGKFSFEEKTYWDPQFYFEKSLLKNEKEIIVELEGILESAIGYRMVSDVPVGVFLSGGYDSSLVASILKNKLNFDISCFSIGFEEKKYDESKFASEVANYLGVKHHSHICTLEDAKELLVKLVDVYDEPFGDSSAIPTLLVSKYASQHVKVVLSADGGDEIFGGYSKYVNTLKYFRSLNNIPRLLRQLSGIIPDELIKMMLNLFSEKNLNLEHVIKFKNIINSENILQFMIKMGENPRNKLFNNNSLKLPNSNLDGLNSLLLYDYQNYLESDILKKVDRATMFYSIEGREPLLDHRIFEFMARVPASLKIKNNVTKYLLKDVVHKYLPETIMNRPKMGFGIPIDKMIHDDKGLFEYFYDTISDEEIKHCEYLNFAEFSKIKNLYSKNYNNGFISLWYLFNFIRWKQKIYKL
jgi:asparagine synthase (glutamine-hydrolysing)